MVTCTRLSHFSACKLEKLGVVKNEATVHVYPLTHKADQYTMYNNMYKLIMHDDTCTGQLIVYTSHVGRNKHRSMLAKSLLIDRIY